MSYSGSVGHKYPVTNVIVNTVLLSLVDSEYHCLTDSIVGQDDRSALFDNIASRNAKFVELCNVDKFKSLVCPVSAIDCKLVSRYLDSHFKARDIIDSSV